MCALHSSGDEKEAHFHGSLAPHFPLRHHPCGGVHRLRLLGSSATFAKNHMGATSETLSGDYLSAAVAGADHDPQAASKYYRRALALDKGNPELIERAFAAMLAAGEIEGSFSYASKLQGRGQHNTLASLALAVKAIKTGDFKQARDLLAKLGGADSSDVTALALTAWSEAGLGHTQKALATLARLKGAESIGAYRAYHTALINDLAGNVEEARKAYKEAQDLEPSTMRLVDARARFEARAGDTTEAKRLYGDFERNAPRNPLIKQGLADIEKGAGDTSPHRQFAAGRGRGTVRSCGQQRTRRRGLCRRSLLAPRALSRSVERGRGRDARRDLRARQEL